MQEETDYRDLARQYLEADDMDRIMAIRRQLVRCVGPDSDGGGDARCFVFGDMAVISIYDNMRQSASTFVLRVE